MVDLHAITGKYDAASLASRTRDMTVGLLAAGVDPEKATLFVQSQVPEHAELQWLFEHGHAARRAGTDDAVQR